jgi:hypothetical protein
MFCVALCWLTLLMQKVQIRDIALTCIETSLN